MNEQAVIGAATVIFGTVVALFGDRTIRDSAKDGYLARLVSSPNWWVRIIKWPIGLASIAMGIWMLLTA